MRNLSNYPLIVFGHQNHKKHLVYQEITSEFNLINKKYRIFHKHLNLWTYITVSEEH